MDVKSLEPRIEAILRAGDLSTISAKAVRRQLATETGQDFTSVKSELDVLIGKIYSRVAEEKERETIKLKNASVVVVKKESAAVVKTESKKPQPPPPPPPRRVPAASRGNRIKSEEIVESDEDDETMDPDERLARKLQAEEHALSSRRGRHAATPKKPRKPREVDPNAPKRQTGFMKPMALSPELAAFIGESEMGRPTIVKRLWTYIKENNLQNPKDKRQIIFDDKLKAIFKVAKTTGFAINKLLSDHVRKPEDVVDGWDNPPKRGSNGASAGRKRGRHDSEDDDDDDDDEDDEDDENGEDEDEEGDEDEDGEEDGEDDDDEAEEILPKSTRRGTGASSSSRHTELPSVKRIRTATGSKPASASKSDAPVNQTGFNKPMRLSTELAAFIGEPTMGRPTIVKRLWAYIKANNLQDPSKKTEIINDEVLRGIFGQDRMGAFEMNKLLTKHLTKITVEELVELRRQNVKAEDDYGAGGEADPMKTDGDALEDEADGDTTEARANGDKVKIERAANGETHESAIRQEAIAGASIAPHDETASGAAHNDVIVADPNEFSGDED